MLRMAIHSPLLTIKTTNHFGTSWISIISRISTQVCAWSRKLVLLLRYSPGNGNDKTHTHTRDQMNLLSFASRIAENAQLVAPDAALVVDVGGGFGHELEMMRKECPDIPAERMVLQDRPNVIEEITRLDPPESRGVRKMAHDFFAEQPVKGNCLINQRGVPSATSVNISFLQVPWFISSRGLCMTGPISIAGRFWDAFETLWLRSLAS